MKFVTEHGVFREGVKARYYVTLIIRQAFNGSEELSTEPKTIDKLNEFAHCIKKDFIKMLNVSRIMKCGTDSTVINGDKNVSIVVEVAVRLKLGKYKEGLKVFDDLLHKKCDIYNFAIEEFANKVGKKMIFNISNKEISEE